MYGNSSVACCSLGSDYFDFALSDVCGLKLSKLLNPTASINGQLKDRLEHFIAFAHDCLVEHSDMVHCEGQADCLSGIFSVFLGKRDIDKWVNFVFIS